MPGNQEVIALRRNIPEKILQEIRRAGRESVFGAFLWVPATPPFFRDPDPSLRAYHWEDDDWKRKPLDEVPPIEVA